MAKLALPEFLLVEGVVDVTYSVTAISGYNDLGEPEYEELGLISFQGVIEYSGEVGDSGKLNMSVQGQSISNRYILYYPVGIDIAEGGKIYDPSGSEYVIGKIKPFSSHREAVLTKVLTGDGIMTQ